MNSIAILYICTGEYYVFWEKFYESFEKYFLTDCPKRYFVFTDYSKDYFKGGNIEVIYQRQLGWPFDTLLRFEMFSNIIDRLEKYDYIFFMNANMQCVTSLSPDEFLPQNEGLIFVKHPGFWNKNRDSYTYESNPKSTAYIKKNEGKYYVCGGVNGGKSAEYIKLIKEIKEKVQKDLDNEIIAVWHDESHLNRYLIDHSGYKILGPEYCYPEGWKLPFKAKLLVRKKSKYINVISIKGGLLKYIKEYILHKKNVGK